MENLKPALVSAGVNFQYIIDRDELIPGKDESISPSTAALHWCMYACGVHRIFSREDLEEFLFRLPITLHCLQLLDNWFGYDELFTFNVGANSYVFSVQDIFRHYGIEILDSLENFRSREHFISEIESQLMLNRAMFVGLLGGIQVVPLDASIDDDGTITVNLKDKSRKPGLTDKLLDDARFFSSDVMNLAPSGLFDNQGRFQAKYDEIVLRKKDIASIPKFDLSKIPSELRVKCMSLMFDPKWVESCQGQDDEDYIDYEKRYIYLAWLFANDLMGYDHLGIPVPLEGVDFQDDDYEVEDDIGGCNLQITFDNFNIQEVEPLLKGVLYID